MKNNKNSKSILYKEIENKFNHNNKITTLTSFWKVKSPNNAEELYNNFKNIINSEKFYLLLNELSKVETDILELIYNYDGITTRAQIVASMQHKYSIDFLRNAVTELISKYIIYERKTLNNLTTKSFKYIIFDEVLDSLKKINFMPYSKELLPKLPHRFDVFKKIDDGLDYDTKVRLYSKNGLITFHELIQEHKNDTDIIKKTYENKSLKHNLIKFNKIIPVFTYNKTINNHSTQIHDDSLKYNSNNYKWIIYLQETFLYIKKSKLSYTQKGLLKKNDYEALLKICENNKKMLDFLFNLILELELIKEKDNKLYIDINYRKFLNENIENKIRKIFNNTSHFNEINSYLKNIKYDDIFTIYDVLRQYFIDNTNESSFFNSIYREQYFNIKLEKLYLLGLIDKVEDSKPTAYAFTNILNKLLLRQINKLHCLSLDRESEKGGILVNRDFTLFIYPEKISDYHKLIINSFTEKISHTEIITRRITKKSIQDAIYLGYNLDEFKKIITDYSKIPPDEQIMVYIKEWSNSQKRVRLKQVYVLESDSDIIDTIVLDPEIDIGKIEKIGDNHIILENPDKIPHSIGLDNIYVFKQDEDF